MVAAPPAPLCFVPHYHPRVWGGSRIASVLGRTLPDDQPCGESWELSDRPDCQSTVADGPLAGTPLHTLWTERRAEIFGDAWNGARTTRFPLLIKVLDCTDDLSIQVHPPADVAPRLGGEPKSEMWHFVAVEPGAKLYAGVREGVTRDAFETALAAGTVADCVHILEPAAGDSLMVHSGRLHALGAGLLVFEIQQNSDTTYRVFDWNRMGLDGLPRQLHVEESLRCIDFADCTPVLHRSGQPGPLAACDHFRVVRRSAGSTAPAAGLIMALEPLTWQGVPVGMGRVAVWPAIHGPPPPPEGGAWLDILPGS